MGAGLYDANGNFIDLFDLQSEEEKFYNEEVDWSHARKRNKWENQNTLTRKQNDSLTEFRDMWTDRVFSTQPADRDAVEKGVLLQYEAAGMRPPEITWVTSPLKGAIAATLLTTEEPIAKRLCGGVIDRVDKAIEKRIHPMELDRVKKEILDPVVERIWPVMLAISSELEYRVNRLRMNGAEDVTRRLVLQAVFGSFDGQLGFYDYAYRALGVQECEALRGMFLASSAGWYWPFATKVIISERPSVLLFDGKEKLHCQNNTAIRYPDGFGAHCWRGTWVPAEAIHKPEAAKWDQLVDCGNPDLRDALAEIKTLKWAKVGAKPRSVLVEKVEETEKVDVPVEQKVEVPVVEVEKKADAVAVVDDVETEAERYEAAMAVKRLGGLVSLKDLIEYEEKEKKEGEI